MKIQVHYAHWKKVRHLLKLERIENTVSIGGLLLRNYIKLLDAPNSYPRIHFMVRELRQRQRLVTVNFHVDTAQHQTDIYHPQIEKIINIFNNS